MEIDVAVTEPSAPASPVTTTLVPAVRSSNVPVTVFLIVVLSSVLTVVVPLWVFTAMLLPETLSTVPNAAGRPPAAANAAAPVESVVDCPVRP